MPTTFAIFNMYISMLELSLRSIVDALFCVKVATKTSQVFSVFMCFHLVLVDDL